jgi:hypothetical protein
VASDASLLHFVMQSSEVNIVLTININISTLLLVYEKT